jgi:transposase-like protein
MSSIIDVLRVGHEHDGRRKISDEQRQEVRRLYEVEQKSIHSISRITGVSRRSVQFILFPERAEIVKARAKEVKRWEKYNTPEYHTPAVRAHRAKKKMLLKNGLVKITDEILTKQELIKLKKQNYVPKI